jgi:hypothetical protein
MLLRVDNSLAGLHFVTFAMFLMCSFVASMVETTEWVLGASECDIVM